VKRGLRGVKLVVSDAHEGLKAAIARVLGATWQRCRVHWMRNALAHVGKAQQTVVAAALRQAFLQPDHEAARQTWRHVADQLRPRWPKLGRLMDDSEDDVLAYMNVPAQHRTKLHSVNTLERLNKEVKRRADVVGIFPSEQSIVRLIGAVLLEANDGWKHCFQPASAPRHGRRGHGRDARASASQRNPATAAQGRLIRGRLSPISNFHHVDGRYRPASRNTLGS
jgi:putative transposase